VRVDDPSQLPLPASATADPTDTVYGIDFSGGTGSVATQIQAALGAGFAVSNPGGNTLRILDDGGASTTDVTGLKANITQTTLQSGATGLPLFVDGGRGNTPFTGSFDGGSQTIGFAQRITLNPAVVADPASLVKYSATTLSGDQTRPQALFSGLTQANRTFSSAGGIGGASSSYTGTVGDYARRIVETQGANAQNASSLDEGQKTVLSSLQGRFAEKAGVNVDQEMAQLVQLQTAYAANARVISAVKDMMDMLLRI
jgi:flagellar hook-associated protein 1 FlgK